MPGKRTLTQGLSGPRRSDAGAGAVTLADVGHADLAARVGVDPGAVRVHEGDGVADGMGARAVTRGTDIHFADGELDADDVSFLIGHELAHVVQQRQGGVTPQARRAIADDRHGLEIEADRVGLAVAAGANVAGTIRGQAMAGVAQRFESFEHRDVGDEATRGPRGELKTVELAPDYRVSYGEVVALAGDFFGSHAELCAMAAVAGKGAGTREEIDYIRRVKLPVLEDAERDARTAEFTPSAVTAANRRYYQLASSNASHFLNPDNGGAGGSPVDGNAPGVVETMPGRTIADGRARITSKSTVYVVNSASHYQVIHQQALDEAMAAGEAGQSIDRAMATNAFADHYLTDSFSGGHLRPARIGATAHWNARVPMFFYNLKGYVAEKLAYYIDEHNLDIGLLTVDAIKCLALPMVEAGLAAKGVVDMTFGDVVCGAIHDYDNERGVTATVDGAPARLFGDGNLGKGDTRALVARAVQASVADVEAAYEIGRAGGNHGELRARIAPRGKPRAEEMIPAVTPDAELGAGDQPVKWDHPDVSALLDDETFRGALKVFLRVKKAEFAAVGSSLEEPYQREAFQNAVLARLDGDAGVRTISEIVHWTPNTGRGLNRTDQDDNAYAYYQQARLTAGGLATLQVSQRIHLIGDLTEGERELDEIDAALELLSTCSDDEQLHQVISELTWARLEDVLGKRFAEAYPEASYG